MRKVKMNLFALIAVAIAAVTMSFNMVKNDEVKVEPRLENLKWFQVDANRTTSEPVSQAHVTYLGEGTTPPEPEIDCNGSNYQCVSGFTENQVNSSDQIIGSQMPATVASLKN